MPKRRTASSASPPASGDTSSGKRVKMDPEEASGPSTRPGSSAAVSAPAPSPSPTLKLNTSTALISQYVGSLRNNLSEHNAVYTCESVEGGFACHLELPFNSPVLGADSGGAFRSKQLAKQSAAFRAVELLMAAGEINHALLPTPANPSGKRVKGDTVATATTRAPPAGLTPKATNGTSNGTPKARKANGLDSSPEGTPGGASGCVVSGDRTTAALVRPPHPEEVQREKAREHLGKHKSSMGIVGQDEYDFFATAPWWAKTPPLGTTLVPAVLTLTFDGDHGQSEYWKQCGALALLTSVPLPLLEDGPFPLDISLPNITATAILTPFASIEVSNEQAELAFKFTRLFLRGLLNKTLDGTPDKTAYYVLPLKSSYPRDGTASQMHVEDIAWDVIARAEGPFTRPFDFSDVEGLQAALDDAMISTPAELGRRFYVTGLRTDLTPSSPDPTSEGKSYYEAALAKEPWEYRTRKANVLTWPEQPLVEVEPVVGPKGGGVTASLVDMSRRNSKCVIAEFLSLYFLPASVYRTGTALVSALSTLDDELIAVDLSTTLFNGLLDRAIVREAITSPAAHAYPGGINYERLEILGDTILKFITTTAMYVGLGRKKTEGAMTYDRHKVVSNRALQASIIESGVVPYIRGTNRRARDFVPPGWFLRGTQETGPQKQTLGDKTVADVAEALVAAAYLSSDGDMQAVLEAMDVLHIDVGVRTWAELASRTHPCDPIAEPLTVLGYTFRNPDRGRVAITLNHDTERRNAFERLEFLGDAVIDYLMLKPLWTEHPDLGPAPLTHMKHSRVANSALGAFLVCSGMHKRLTDMDPAVRDKLDEYAVAITAKRARADTQLEKGKASHEFWNQIPGHKWMGDVVEALFGAIFEDSGFDVPTVRGVFEQHLFPFLDKYAVPPAEHSLHPKSMLLELLATRRCHQWSIERTPAPDGPEGHVAATVIVHGTVVGSAVEPKVALAVRSACDEALTTLKDVTVCPCM